jgi:hypothetical protein
MEGMVEGGQALKVNNGGERSPKTLLVQGGRRVFICEEKYGRWKQPTGQFGRKSGGAGLWAGWSGGTGLSAGCPMTRQADSATRRKSIQTRSSAAPPDWPGPPSEGPAWSPAWLDQGPKWIAQKPNNF